MKSQGKKVLVWFCEIGGDSKICESETQTIVLQLWIEAKMKVVLWKTKLKINITEE